MIGNKIRVVAIIQRIINNNSILKAVLQTNSYAVNMKTREHGSQNSRKLKMSPVRLKNGSHFGSRIFWVNKVILIAPLTT